MIESETPFLTEEQEQLLKHLNNLCKEKKSQTVVLNCPAGTGKTFFIKYLFKHTDLNIRVLAPTHKAKSLFSVEDIPCMTIHKYLNGEKDVDEKTGEIYFRFSKNIFKKTHDVLIVDECSMINRKMLEALESEKIVLFTGDDHQLPPVGEEISPVFNRKYETFSFTENMRIQTDPDSMSALYLNKFRNLVDNPNSKVRIETRQSISKAIKYFKKNKDCVVLAWTNKQVSYLNGKIRKKLYAQDSELKKYYEGETLVFSGYRPTNVILKVEDNQITYLKYHSSDSIDIVKLSEINEEVKYYRCEHQTKADKLKTCKICDIKGHRNISQQIKFYKIEDHNGIEWQVPFDEANEEKIKAILSDLKRHCLKMKNKILWAQYYDMKNLYNPDLFYRYAMTVHKSQGSQWEKVFVDINNLRACRDMDLSAKLSYTAVSRYRNYVFFL